MFNGNNDHFEEDDDHLVYVFYFQGVGLAVLSVLGITLLVVQLQPKVCQLFNEMTYVLPVWD